MKSVPGLEVPAPHKPKQRPARKVQALCDALGISDAIVPALALLWKRYKAGESGRNGFEKSIHTIFASLGAKEQSAMAAGFDGYAALRQSGKGECLFNDCLAKAGRDSAIERSWFAEEMLREGLRLAGHVLFKGSGGVMGPGQVRLWDNKVYHGPNGSGVTVYQGPWPWLTAICPDVSSDQEFGNLESFRPAPNSSHEWQNYEYAQTCDYKPDPSGKITATCARQHPPPPPPPAPGQPPLFTNPNTCEGGPHYTHQNDCLRIPAQRAGGSIKLRGFNWITPTVKVRAVLTSDTSVFFEQNSIVWGDRETPLKDPQGHFIVDERVHDWVDFQIPGEHPSKPNAKLPPGIYSVFVTVSNITNAIYDGSPHAEFETNRLLLRIEPDANVKYLMWNERGRCNRETPGMGDDEIWWDAFVGHIVANDIPVPPTGSSGLDLKNVERRSFPRPPWEDMDDGETASGYKQDIWGPGAFELYGVVAVAIVGFEVDSEDAAQEQLQGFWNAWGKALSEIVGVGVGASGTATGIAKLAYEAGLIAAKTAFAAAVIAVVVIAAVVLICTILWAVWAPADLIALDLFTLDAFTAWDKTDPKKPLPPETKRWFADETLRESIEAVGDLLVAVTERPLPKDHKAGDAAAAWIQENQYDTPEDTEDASYTLEFRMARS